MQESRKRPTLWRRLNGPTKIGIGFALLGAILAAVGMFRGFAPLTARAFITAVVISAAAWGVVSWAIAEATAQVEGDIAEDEVEQARNVSGGSADDDRSPVE
jgi:hypothetical protein